MPQKKTVFSGQSLRGWYNFLMRINHSVGVFIGVFTALTLVLGLAFSILHSSSSSAQANFPGWSNIATIYYNSSQEDPNNTFLQQAADELKLQLEKVSGTYTITTTSPPSTISGTGNPSSTCRTRSVSSRHSGAAGVTTTRWSFPG